MPERGEINCGDVTPLHCRLGYETGTGAEGVVPDTEGSEGSSGETVPGSAAVERHWRSKGSLKYENNKFCVFPTLCRRVSRSSEITTNC